MRLPHLFTRAIPAANSGASSPLSDASAASLRMADILTMMDDEPRPRASSDARHALTVAFVKPGCGACRNQSMNSSNTMLYTRRVIGEDTLSSTSAFNLFHSAGLSTTIRSFIFVLDNWCYRQLFVSETTSGSRRLAHINESGVFRQLDGCRPSSGWCVIQGLEGPCRRYRQLAAVHTLGFDCLAISSREAANAPASSLLRMGTRPSSKTT